MTDFIEITPQQAWEMSQKDENAVLADVRDQVRFNYSHAQGAVNLTEHTWPDFEA